MKKFILLLPLLFSIVSPSLVFADTFNPSSALQYYEYYENGTKEEKSIQYGNNIYLSSEYDNIYPYAMSLILYGNYIADKTYTINVNVNTRFTSNHFKFYYENLNYLIVSAQIVSGTERTLCNLQPITQNQSYSVGCTFKPTSNLSQVILSLVNYDYQNNGYVPIGSTDYVTFNNYSMAVYDDSSNIIIDQNNTIINQNNQNTQQIIDSSASNTQAIIDSNMVCETIDKNKIDIEGKALGSSGGQQTDNNYGITKYIPITKNSILKKVESNSTVYYAMCFYNVNKTLISCTGNNSVNLNEKITVPNKAEFVRFSINKNTNQPQFEVCDNGSQALNSSIKDLDSTLNDDDTSGATSEASDFFGSFTTDTFGLTSIITAPLSLIQSLLSSTCSDLELPLPYLDNKKLTLPCMSVIYSTYFGTFFTLYQTITYGIVAYWVCVRIFNLVKDFKNPEHDEIEVLDL